jgi:hypothetical protein
VKSVSEEACLKTWTGVVHLEDGRRLPDLKAWDREFRAAVGALLSIEGVEATVEGRLVLVKGELALRLGASGVVLRLGNLRKKVQWDPTRNRPQPATCAEREAHLRLAARLARHRGPPPRVRVVGPLLQAGMGRLPILTVREFVWN